MYKLRRTIRQPIKNELYLSGGGDEHQSFPLDSFFFEKIPQNGTFLYIPIALRGHKLYATAALWMKNILALHKREDVTFELWDDVAHKTYADVARFDAMYIGGGNTWSLMEELRGVDFPKVIAEFLEKKGSVYGGSAGAIVMGKRIDTHDDKNEISWTDMNGFAMTGNYSVACHFKEEQTGRFQEWATTHQLPILCLPEETGLVFTETEILCVGAKPCFVYASDGNLGVLHDGDRLPL